MLSKQKLKVVVVKAVLVMVVILVVGGSNYKVELTLPFITCHSERYKSPWLDAGSLPLSTGTKQQANMSIKAVLLLSTN